MNRNKILLGRVRKDYKKGNSSIAGERIFLSKHSFDCGWYWGFGYVGNPHLHTHFNSELLGSETDINKIFEKPLYTQSEWWILRDLFIQAYALRECAEVYRYGGHQTTKKGLTDLIKDKEIEDRLNKDLEKVLNKIWWLLTRDRTKIKTALNKISSLKDKIKNVEGTLKEEEDKIKVLEKEIRKENKVLNEVV